jgi:sugar phosphate isomerase/epimerase
MPTSIPIGVRRGWSAWQKDLPAFLAWCRQNALSVIDLGPDLDAARQTQAAGLTVGTLDFGGGADWKNLIAPDKPTRDAAVQKAAALITDAAKLKIHKFFAVMLPLDPARPRPENFAFMLDSLAALIPALEQHRSQLLIEGWPGPGSLVCTPETYRHLFTQLPSPALGINYDPSHLIRMHIDPLRFLLEFASRIHHAHAKDCQFLPDPLYTYGTELAPTLPATNAGYGGLTWRYTIPGKGQTDWAAVLRVLTDADYHGALTIELEDADYNGTEEGEKRGILAGAGYLRGC